MHYKNTLSLQLTAEVAATCLSRHRQGSKAENMLTRKPAVKTSTAKTIIEARIWQRTSNENVLLNK